MNPSTERQAFFGATTFSAGDVRRLVHKRFVTREDVEYVREDGGAPRPARSGEKYAYVADLVHGRRRPFGRQRTRRT